MNHKTRMVVTSLALLLLVGCAEPRFTVPWDSDQLEPGLSEWKMLRFFVGCPSRVGTSGNVTVWRWKYGEVTFDDDVHGETSVVRARR